jgi:hypothetical protein
LDVQLSAILAEKLLPFVTLFGAWHSQALAAIPSERALPTIRVSVGKREKLILVRSEERATAPRFVDHAGTS